MPVVMKPGSRELHGERQADVTEADDADAGACASSMRRRSSLGNG